MYASKQKFAGQRASVGRVVVVNMGGTGVQAGIIQKIGDGDNFAIQIWDPMMIDGNLKQNCQFVETKTEEEVDAIPPGSWTWPVRV